jgi:hypothetical protein
MTTNEINTILEKRYAIAVDEVYHGLDHILYNSDVKSGAQARATIDAMFRYFGDDLMAESIDYATHRLKVNRAVPRF